MYTREDYMRGIEPPRGEVLPILWHYGVRWGKGKLGAFWSRTLPQGPVVVCKDIWAPPTSPVPRQKAEALLLELQRAETLPPATLPPGTICIHNDSGGHHMALIVGVVGELAYAVFLTSAQNWNAYVRHAKPVEVEMLGGRGKQAWLAPVVRPLSAFYAAQGQVEYQVIKAYQLEFMRAYHSGRT